ncbi:MAG TPA: hypothetical protein VF384_15755 [Planctomycetota bacterium]
MPTSPGVAMPAATVTQEAAPIDKEQPAGTAVESDVNHREAVAPQFAGPTGEVQVVRFDTRTPIEKATVYSWPPDFEWWNPEARPPGLSGKDYDALRQRMSLAFTTDGEGRCRVPLGKFGAQVTAVKDELWGQGHVPKDAAAPVVLALRADHTLRVLVVDAGGRPARGVMVRAIRSGDRPMNLGLGVTDAAGRLEHRHVQQLASEDPTAKIELAAEMTGGESAPVLVDVTAPPPEVVLQLPPCGTVTVHVRDADGKPIDATFLGEPSVHLTTFDERPGNENAEREALNRLNRAYGGVGIDERGDAVFDRVALDRFVIASAGSTLRSAVVAGPTLENPHVEVTVSEGADDVVLTGTLLDAQGMPYATSPFMATCTYRGMRAQRGLTNASGRFRIAVTGLPAGQPIAVSFDTKVANKDAPQACELPPRLLTKGRNDLGEVRLAPLSILVEGRVVRADGGEPVQVPILIERKRDGRWQQEYPQAEWGKAGAFTMRSGIAKGTPIRLLVMASGFLPVAPIECAAGDTGIELALQKGGSARATFLVDDTVPLERLTLRFRPTDSPQQVSRPDGIAGLMELMRNHPTAPQAKDGRVQQDWQGLKPGRYRLQALCTGVAEPIATIDAVEIAEGPCADPRLVDIDLRGRIRVFEIRATTSDGTAVASRDAFVVIRSSGDDWSGFHLGAGVVKIGAPSVVDLVVVAKGHKTAFVNGVSDARTIALEVAAETHVALVLPSPLPEGAALRLRLRPALELPRSARLQLDTGRPGLSVADFFAEEAIVDAAGKATVPVRCPGLHTVEATLSFGPRGGAYIRDFDPPTITLPASGEVAVRVGQKGLDQALETARR